MCKLQFLDKHLVTLLTVAVLVAMLFATSGCGAVDGLAADVAGTANALREWTAPLEARAREKDNERSVKWATIYRMQQEDFEEIGYDPKKLPKLAGFLKFGNKK